MVCHKNTLLLFGGFYDTGKEVRYLCISASVVFVSRLVLSQVALIHRYYNDLWQLDLDNLKWTSLGAGAAGSLATWPSPRSGCALFIHDSCLVVHGGYRREPGDADDDGVDRGTPLHDTWQFQVDEAAASGGNAQQKHTWGRVKRLGMGPSPRSGFAAVTLAGKHRGLLFGGVSDTEAKGGEVLISEFHSECFVIAMDAHRWFPLTLKLPPGSNAAQAAQPARSAEGSEASAAVPSAKAPSASLTPAEQALHRAATRIQANWRGFAVRKVLHIYRIGGAVSEMTYAPALGFPPPNVPTPFGRIGAAMCYDPRNDVAWLFGGLVELGDEAEVSFDDLWALRLSKGGAAGGTWDCVRAPSVSKEQLRRMAEEQGRQDESELEGDESSSDSSD
jgi:hypothetical protein